MKENCGAPIRSLLCIIEIFILILIGERIVGVSFI
jgi:hypothetical protein